MSARFSRGAAFFTLGVLAFLMAFGRGSQTQAISPAPSTYDYKVEFVKQKKQLEGRLKEDLRDGWRLHSVVASPADNEFVVILEKASMP